MSTEGEVNQDDPRGTLLHAGIKIESTSEVILMKNSTVKVQDERIGFHPAQAALDSFVIRDFVSEITRGRIESLFDKLLLDIFVFVEIPDLGKLSQVSTHWNRVANIPWLWEFMGTRHYGDFLSPEDLSENPKQKVVYHYLSVIVNYTENLREIDRLVCRYQLHLYAPHFKKYLAEMNSHLGYGYPRVCLSSREELIMQGNGYFIEEKIEGLNNGHNGYRQDLEAARELNEFLIQREDRKAIERKIKGLTCGGEEQPAISPSDLAMASFSRDRIGSGSNVLWV